MGDVAPRVVEIDKSSVAQCLDTRHSRTDRGARCKQQTAPACSASAPLRRYLASHHGSLQAIRLATQCWFHSMTRLANAACTGGKHSDAKGRGRAEICTALAETKANQSSAITGFGVIRRARRIGGGGSTHHCRQAGNRHLASPPVGSTALPSLLMRPLSVGWRYVHLRRRQQAQSGTAVLCFTALYEEHSPRQL